MNTNHYKASQLAKILEKKDEVRIKPTEPKPSTAELENAKRKAIIQNEADMILMMDEHLRKVVNYDGYGQWRLFQAHGQFQDLVEDRYRLSRQELEEFRRELLDLIDAGIPGLEYDPTSDYQNTARIILRVMYADNWVLFLDHMTAKLKES